MASLSPLKAYRAKSKLTLAKASALFGVHKTTFMRWGKNRVPAEMVLDLERKLGISRHDLRPDIYPAARVVEANPKSAA